MVAWLDPARMSWKCSSKQHKASRRLTSWLRNAVPWLDQLQLPAAGVTWLRTGSDTTSWMKASSCCLLRPWLIVRRDHDGHCKQQELAFIQDLLSEPCV